MNISEVSEFDVGLARRASCMPHFKLRRRGTRRCQHKRPLYEVHSNANRKLQKIRQEKIFVPYVAYHGSSLDSEFVCISPYVF